MKKLINSKIYMTFILFLGCLNIAHGQLKDDVVMKAIQSEVERNKTELRIPSLEKPFWISYRFLRATYTVIVASEGDLVCKETRQSNMGTSDLFVGNYAFNNNNFQSCNHSYRLPVGETNMESALHYAIWGQLDVSYKKMAEAYERKKVQVVQQNIPADERSINDWDQSTPAQYIENAHSQNIDLDFWSNYGKNASLALGQHPSILNSEFRIEIVQGDMYYYSTDGFAFKVPVCFAEMTGTVCCRTNEGQEMGERYRYYLNNLNDVIPINDLCSEMIGFNALLVEESRAPLLSDSYSGPVLLEGTAVSNAFCQNFINSNNGLISKRKVLPQAPGLAGESENRMEQLLHKKVTDRRLDVVSMTGTPAWKGQKLMGYTPIDAQGVKPDSVLILVEKGILKNLLSDRTPTKTNLKSNGHSRFIPGSSDAQLGAGVLWLKATQTIPEKALKDSLLAAAKEEGYDFAFLYRGFNHTSGGFLYKVYPDGREEMVRNGTISDMNAKQFKYIQYISDRELVHNTTIGESPVSLIVPTGILFKEMEIVRNTNITFNKPYLVPRPERKQYKHND